MFNFIFSAAALLIATTTNAQSLRLSELENDKSHEATEKFLAKTQGVIARSNVETAARAKEIEELTERVSRLITNLGSSSEDATNLRSELSVSKDLLNLERETTAGLRKESQILNQQISNLKQKSLVSEMKFRRELNSLRTEHAKALRRLNQTIEKMNVNLNTNRRMKASLLLAETKIEKLERHLLKLRQKKEVKR